MPFTKYWSASDRRSPFIAWTADVEDTSDASLLVHEMADVTGDGYSLCQRFLVSTSVGDIRRRVSGKQQFSHVCDKLEFTTI
jgi:hypothetical protein